MSEATSGMDAPSHIAAIMRAILLQPNRTLEARARAPYVACDMMGSR